jgi:elongation of very long chain fatty acids protein 7
MENFIDQWNYFTYDKADPRSREKFLMGSPLSVISISIFYLLFIKILTNFMLERKAINIKAFSFSLHVYFLAGNIFFFFEAGKRWLGGYNWRCEPLDRSYSTEALKEVDLIYAFFIFKLTYMMETFPYILLKNSRFNTKYISLHHSTFPVIVWLIANYSPGGHATFTGFVNSFAHIIFIGGNLTFIVKPELRKRWWRTIVVWLHVSFYMKFSV